MFNIFHQELLDFFLVANDETRRNVTGLMKEAVCSSVRYKSATRLMSSDENEESIELWHMINLFCFKFHLTYNAVDIHMYILGNKTHFFLL